MKDDNLILYFYKDGLSQAERQQVGDAIAADPAVAERYRLLSSDLSGLAMDEPVSLPGGLAARLHATVDRAASLESGRQAAPRRRVHFWSFLLGTAITAAIVAGVGIAFRTGNDPVAPIQVPAMAQQATETLPGAFERGMKVYFRDSRHDLQALPPEGGAERTALIMTLVEQNRLFAQLAIHNDSPQLARVLRAFEPILVRLAAEDITAEESAALRAKLEFEINVMLTKLTREASEFSQPTEQET